MKPLSWSRRIWKQIGFWAFGFLFLFGNSFRRYGMFRVPRAGPFLIISNHESFWDPPIVGITVGRPISYMARKTLFDHPTLKYLIERQGAFPVDQEGTGMDGIKIALKRFQDGEGVLVFPEGTRSPDGELKEFMMGIVLLIRKARVPVLPVGIAGVYDAWPCHAKWPRWSPLWSRANKASVCGVIGELIPAEKLLDMKPAEMLKYLFDEVARVRAEAYQRKRK